MLMWFQGFPFQFLGYSPEGFVSQLTRRRPCTNSDKTFYSHRNERWCRLKVSVRSYTKLGWGCDGVECGDEL